MILFPLAQLLYCIWRRTAPMTLVERICTCSSAALPPNGV